MTEWIELFKIEKEKKGVKTTTTISLNVLHEKDWLNVAKEWISGLMRLDSLQTP